VTFFLPKRERASCFIDLACFERFKVGGRISAGPTSQFGTEERYVPIGKIIGGRGLQVARDAGILGGPGTDYELYEVMGRKPGSSIYMLWPKW
jgi:hypothetical protein